MARDVSVNIGLHIGKYIVDLRVPKLVKKWHLKRVIVEALLMMRVKIPADFELRIGGKQLEVSDSALYDEYALGDGDQIEIVLIGGTNE